MTKYYDNDEYHPATPCCRKRYPLTIPYPVQWNPYSKVVECHACGAIYTIQKPISTAEQALIQKFVSQCTIPY